MKLTQLSSRQYGIACAAIGTAALAAAAVMQLGFGLYPCTLCIYQRWPYALLILLGALFAWKPKHIIWLLIVCTLLASAGLAGYHAGVEQGLFEGTSSCSPDSNAGNLSLDDLRALIEGAPIASCKDAAATLFGLSITMWNGLFSLSLLCVHLYYRKRILP